MKMKMKMKMKKEAKGSGAVFENTGRACERTETAQRGEKKFDW